MSRKGWTGLTTFLSSVISMNPCSIFPTFKLHLAAALCIAIRLRDKFAYDVMMTQPLQIGRSLAGTCTRCPNRMHAYSCSRFASYVHVHHKVVRNCGLSATALGATQWAVAAFHKNNSCTGSTPDPSSSSEGAGDARLAYILFVFINRHMLSGVWFDVLFTVSLSLSSPAPHLRQPLQCTRGSQGGMEGPENKA